MARILVAGAGGYIGIPLCETLLRNGHEVVALDTYYFGQRRMLWLGGTPSLNVLASDIRDVTPLALVDVDIVIDLAGFSNDASSELSVELTNAVNLQGAQHLARAAKLAGVKRYIYMSSAAVYGQGRRQSLTETDECRPMTLYAHIKLQMESYFKELQSEDFETVIFRNATAFGMAPRMRLDLAVNAMTLHAWKDKVIPMTGSGQQWRPFVHVKDIVQAISLGVQGDSAVVSGQTFNVGCNEMNMRISTLSRSVSEVFPQAVIQPTSSAFDNRSYHVSFDKITSWLGLKCKSNVLEGVMEVSDALSNGVLRFDDPTCYTLQWYKTLFNCTKHPLASRDRPPMRIADDHGGSLYAAATAF